MTLSLILWRFNTTNDMQIAVADVPHSHREEDCPRVHVQPNSAVHIRNIVTHLCFGNAGHLGLNYVVCVVYYFAEK